MEAGFDPIAYAMTLNASTKVSKPSVFRPSESYFERYNPARMTFSRVVISWDLTAIPFSLGHPSIIELCRSASYKCAINRKKAKNLPLRQRKRLGRSAAQIMSAAGNRRYLHRRRIRGKPGLANLLFRSLRVCADARRERRGIVPLRRWQETSIEIAMDIEWGNKHDHPHVIAHSSR